MKKLYLANPYGFSAQQRTELLPTFIEMLTALGAEVLEPFERNNAVDIEAPGEAWRVGQKDLADIRAADAVFAIVNGTPPDEGVMVELGYAIARGKPTFLFRDDLRNCSDSSAYPLNLMLFAGLPVDGWEDWFYTSLEEIASPEKALVRWLTEV